MEIESLDALDRALAGSAPLAGLRLQGLDLRGRAAALLARTDLEGLVVLGGQLTPELEHHLRRCRALIFPERPARPGRPLPGDPVPARGAVRRAGPGRLRRHAGRPRVPLVARRLLPQRRVRDPAAGDPRRLDVRRPGRAGRRPVRGRGDGRPRHPSRHAAVRRGRVPGAVAGPRRVPGGHRRRPGRDGGGQPRRLLPGPGRARRRAGPPRRGALVHRGRHRLGGPRAAGAGGRRTAGGRRASSLGVPTWFYGHEPPGVFVDGLAKFFSNAVREDGLLARCTCRCHRPAGRGRDRAGGLPGGDAPLLRARRRCLRSSSSADSTGPRWSPCGRPSRPSARTGACRAPYTWWTRRRRRWNCSAGDAPRRR